MSSLNKLNIAVIGATGYTGLDLTNILSKHPKVNLLYLCATKNIGKKMSFFDKRLSNKIPRISSIKKINWKKLDLVFLSLPNGNAQEIIKKTFYKYRKLKYIDLSADFRLTNIKTYFKTYKKKHKAPKLIKESLYSISEFNKKKINKFRIISNPGCYPTSIQLPLIPLIQKKLINTKDIIIDAKSGYSGAGKNFRKKFTFKNLFTSSFAYSPKNHRHIAEIQQEFLKHTNKKILFNFNPHIIPTYRGILSSIYVYGSKNTNGKKITNELNKFYAKSKFVKILKFNSLIGTGNVQNTNFCEISICDTEIKNKYIIFSALDNLVKGAAGQAVQNMNLIYKFKEDLGL